MPNPHLNAEESKNSKEQDYENSIRPASMNEFSGQNELIENLSIFIQAAKHRGEALDNGLPHGQPG